MIQRLGVPALRTLVLLLAAAALVGALVLGVVHLRHPFELEWMEGGVVDHVERVARGEKLYVPPTVEFVPFIYAPLYFYASAALTKLFGIGFFACRLVSFASYLGTIALVARFVLREARSGEPGGRGEPGAAPDGRFAAFLAAGLYAATYAESSGFADIARVDSLSVLLLLGSLYALRFGVGVRGRLIAAALFGLSFLTKQSAFVALPALAIYAFIKDGRRAYVFVGAAAGLVTGSVLVLDALHGGWFSYYAFRVPQQHPFVRRMWFDFWVEDLLPLAISVALGLFYVLVDAPAPGEDEASARRRAEARAFHFLAGGALLAMAWSGRLHAGGWPNVIMPAFAHVSILFGLGVHAARRQATLLPEALRPRVEVLVLVLAGVQLACVAYDPRRFVPSRRDVEAGRALVERIRREPGDVWVSAHGHLSTLAGKRAFAHEMAISDLLGIRGDRAAADLRASIAEALREERFSAVVSDGDWFRREIEASYRREGTAIKGSGFFPVLGMRTRPKTIYVARGKRKGDADEGRERAKKGLPSRLILEKATRAP